METGAKTQIRIWSKKIKRVFESYNNQKLILFGITGDIDNLGLFVAENGRAEAENLVDSYNRVIGMFMKSFIKTNQKNIKAFAFIPSGEEIFALGVAKNTKVVKYFFEEVSTKINPLLKSISPIFREQVTISFGTKILNGISQKEIAQFLEATKKHDKSIASARYLALMKKIREILAYELDHAKFKSLHAKEFTILLRNIVYLHLHKYKRETKNTLVKVAKKMKKNKKTCNELKKHPLNIQYGFQYTKQENKIVKRLIKNRPN